jgi:hypothetical protein
MEDIEFYLLLEGPRAVAVENVTKNELQGHVVGAGNEVAIKADRAEQNVAAETWELTRSEERCREYLADQLVPSQLN